MKTEKRCTLQIPDEDRKNNIENPFYMRGVLKLKLEADCTVTQSYSATI